MGNSKRKYATCYKNGLKSYNKVIARHIKNGSKILFNNAVECSRYFNMNVRRFSRHLTSTKVGQLTKNWYVFKYDDLSEWPVLSGTKIQESTWDNLYGMWYAKDLNNGKIYYNDILRNLCEILNITYGRANDALHTDGKVVTFNNWIVWYDDTPLESVVRTIASSRKPPEGIRDSIKIKITNIDSSESFEFDSMTKASNYLHIATKTLKNIIDNKNGVHKEFKIEYLK